LTFSQKLYNELRKFKTLTHEVNELPIAILMPHSSCNCRCVMCDIWKGNAHRKQLSVQDVSGLMESLKRLKTRQVLLSGGEALLHPQLFELCALLKSTVKKISLLTTGLTLKQNVSRIVRHIDDITVSLDGDPLTHNRIRGIPDAFQKMKEGIETIRLLSPGFRINARTVIHRQNFRSWIDILQAARELGVDQISFFPADITSNAFNRNIPWDKQRQEEILIEQDQLSQLQEIIDQLIIKNKKDFESGFIAESPGKLKMIYQHYAALHGLADFPFKKCNAPWISTVIEADGTTRPCFFHPANGNIHDNPLDKIINSNDAILFRKNINMKTDPTCARCVCYLNFQPGKSVNA
jgi:MoaA/NifB/PqqE/SkfB family radical SAM enzyme